MNVRIIDLFAGLGGIRIGFTNAMRKAGISTECVFSSEIKNHAITAYKNYFKDEEIFGDITKVEDVNAVIPDFDFLLAGFPCQPFSSAGTRKGFTDTRGTLFFEIERILKAKMDIGHPATGFLLENVEGLVNHDHGRTLQVILTHLRNLGYYVTYKVLDSQYFGLAQSRKRIYIVGTLIEEISLDSFPVHHAVFGDIMEHGKPTVDSDFTRKLLSHFSTEKLFGMSIKDKRGGKNNIHSWDIELKGPLSSKEKELLNILLKERRKKHWAEKIGIKWMDGMPLTEEMIKTFYDDKELHSILEGLVQKGYLVYEYPKQQIKTESGVLVRKYDKTLKKGYNIVVGKLSFEFTKILDPNDISPTLVATDVSRLGVVDGEGIRRLSVREGLRLCGFPEDYDLSMLKEKEAFDLLGNTVCVPVIEKICGRLTPYKYRNRCFPYYYC